MTNVSVWIGFILSVVGFLGLLNFFSSCSTSSCHQLSGKDEPDIHCRDSVGNTPLHCAAYRGQKQCIIKLLKSGADPSIKNRNGILFTQYLTAVMSTVKVCDFFFKPHVYFWMQKFKRTNDNLCMADCVVGQTALDLACSEELRLILAAYQDKVGTDK